MNVKHSNDVINNSNLIEAKSSENVISQNDFIPGRSSRTKKCFSDLMIMLLGEM